MSHSTDPRNDALVKEPWDTLNEQLRGVIRALEAPAAVRNSLRGVVDLHVAWTLREQVLDGTDSPDMILGIGCRMCHHRPNLIRYPEATPWCSTIEALRVALIDDTTNIHVTPADKADQRTAWHEGWAACVAANKDLFDARLTGVLPSERTSVDPALFRCPYDD